MNVTLQLSGISPSIDFLGNTGRLCAFYRYAYQKFLTAANGADARMSVRLADIKRHTLPFPDASKDPGRIRRVPHRDLAALLDRHPDLSAFAAADPNGIAVWLLNGLLIYSPVKAEGHIVLSGQDDRPYRPLYHLLWVFFSQVLGDRGACFVHAAGVAWKEGGVLFFGGSGEGKSTVSRLCRSGRVFSDDSPIVCSRHGKQYIYPSPIHQFSPEAGPGNGMSPDGAQLERIFFLRRNDRNAIKGLSSQQAFSIILTRNIHFFHFLTETARMKLFDLFYDVCHKISVAYLYFRRDADVETMIAGNRSEGCDVEFG